MQSVFFSINHMWVEKISDHRVRVGISSFAQKKMGNILFINLPDIDDIVVSGRALGDIESIKTVSDLISPVTGKVVDINEELLDEPDRINDNPNESWMIEVEIENEKFDDLLTETEYLNAMGVHDV